MKVGWSAINELCHAAEGLSGTAASASLRKITSLMERAPSGRLFGAIATLSDISTRAAQALEDGSKALDRSDDDSAAAKISDALTQMDMLAAQGVSQKRRRRAARSSRPRL